MGVDGGGGGGGHGTRSKRSTSHSETALWSAARMRGGEVDRNPDVSQELAESAKSPRSPHDIAKAEVREVVGVSWGILSNQTPGSSYSYRISISYQ